MSDLSSLDHASGNELTDEQINAIIAQIDLDIMNIVREGKLSALKYSVGGSAGQSTDRAANLQALLNARDYYQKLLATRPTWTTSSAVV